MTGHTAIDDDAIRAMLDERAGRIGAPTVDIATIVAAAGQRAIGFTIWRRPPTAWTGLAAAVAVVVLTASVALLPLTGRPASSATGGPLGSLTSGPAASVRSGDPGRSASSEAAGPPLVTAAVLGELVRTRSAELAGRYAVVRGPIRLAVPDPGCVGSGCSVATLDGAGGGFTIRVLEPLRTSLSLENAVFPPRFILVRFTDAERELPVLEALSELAMGAAPGPTVTAAELANRQASGTYAIVDGWLVRTPVHSCPVPPPELVPPSGRPVYGCPADEYLTDQAYQPVRADGSFVGPADGLSVPSTSYDRFAPDPASAPHGGVEPRRAVYLLRAEQLYCPPGARCARLVAWVVVDRLDPIPGVAPVTPTEGPEFPVVPPPNGSAWSVAELAGLGFTGPAEYVVRGYLVATPPLRCLDPPAPSGRPDYGCHEINWLTDEPFQPWVAGSVRAPGVGLRVQNRAYATFAPDPRFETGVGNAPRLGIYQVRFSVRSTCDLTASSPGVDCAGGLYFAWEVVGRVGPVTKALPDSCPPDAVVCW